MLTPKKQKYRKAMRNRNGIKGKAYRGGQVAFGDFGLKALVKGEINSRQIEAARRAMTRSIKRGGKIWVRIFPHKPITQKAAEVPMGSGKGNVEYFVATVKPGTILFEMTGVTEKIAREAFDLAAQKLPVVCRFAKPPIR
ncbi:MAG: 50S ribosomal protein L16 [Candidatus Gracilibacteria bacterium]|nr:50S ribosomal protein L16 [bacterium]MDZ4217061.1 50S ribosomal protein L16 [Candidatus Gracilibacteria bacterium]